MGTKKVVKPEPAVKPKAKKPAEPEPKKAKRKPAAKKAEPKPTDEPKKEVLSDKVQADSPKGDESLEIIKAKLRKKYFALREDSLDFATLDKLKAHVCAVLGLNLPELNNVLIDL